MASTFSGTKKGRKHPHRDELGVRRHVGLDGHGNQVDQPPRAGPNGQGSHAHRQTDKGVDQPVTQLHQVLDKGLLRAGQLVLGVFGI